MNKKKTLKNIAIVFIIITLMCGIINTPLSAYAADNSENYYINLTKLTYTKDNTENDIKVYTSDEFNSFVIDYNEKKLPDIYITEFLYDGIDQVKKISVNDANEVTAKTISTTVININTTGNIEFSGTAENTMIAVNTNEITKDINLILNNVNLTSSSSTPAIMVYNKDVTYNNCNVTVKTVKDTQNYITGGKLKKVSTMTEDKVDSYTAVNNQYSDTTNKYYYVYTSDELNNLLFAQETADNEKVAEGDPYNYYKYGGAIGTDIALNFEGEGYLEIASLGDEGVETKGNLNFLGGKGDYKITSFDDGLNASTMGTDILINVNSMLVCVNSDADEGDAIDSNGTIHIQGGTIYAFANPTSQDDGLDSDSGTYINGGTVISTGNMSDSVSDNSEQDFIKLTFREQQKAGDLICITDSNENPVMAFKSDRTFTTLTYSSKDLEKTAYHVYKNGNITGTETNGLYTKIDSYSDGTQQQWSGGGQFGGGGMTPPDNQNGSTPPEIPTGDNQNGSTPPEIPTGDNQNGSTPPEIPTGDNQNGSTPPEIPTGDNQNGSTPPEIPTGDNQNGSTPPEIPTGDNQNGSTPPEIPTGDNQNGNTPPAKPDGDNQNSGEASTEFTISSTSHTFNNVTDYTGNNNNNDNSDNSLLGDVDLDGEITVRDATLIQLYCADLNELTQQQLLNADVDKDEDVNVKDATQIQLYLAHLISQFN